MGIKALVQLSCRCGFGLFAGDSRCCGLVSTVRGCLGGLFTGCFACSTRGKLPFHLWALTGLPLGLTHACTIHTSSIISFHSILGSIRADIVSVSGTAAHWFCSRSCVGHCCRQDQLPLAACQPVSAAAVATNSCPHSSAWLQSSFSSTLSSLRVITFSLFCPPASSPPKFW